MQKLFSKILLFYFILFILIPYPIFANNNSAEFIILVNNKILDLNEYVVYEDGHFSSRSTKIKPVGKNKFLINSNDLNLYIELIKDKNPFAILSVSDAKKVYLHDYISVTTRYVQKPGMSEHQTGLAIDISSNSRNNYSSFEQTTHYKWLKQNSWKYGFIIRYTKDKAKITDISFEPWHLRYVGKPLAELLYKNNWSLEEFTNYITKNKFIIFKTYQGKYYLFTRNGYQSLNFALKYTWSPKYDFKD